MDDKNTEVEAINAKFVGDPNDDFSGPTNMTMFGQDFKKGEYVELTDPAVIRKVRGHSHFQIEGEGEVEATNTGRDDLAQLGAGTGGLERLKELAQSEGVDFDPEDQSLDKAKLMRKIRAKRKADAKENEE